MATGRAFAIAGMAVLALGAGSVVPAIGAPGQIERRLPRGAQLRTPGQFTPASADPRLAASLVRAGALGGSFRFTPSATVRGNPRAVTVAVRSAAVRRDSAADRASAAPVAGLAVNPIAYNLGVSVGWRRFALSGDVRRVDTGALPGSRERVDVGISYSAPRWTARLQAERDEPDAGQPRLVTGGDSYSLDFGGSYRLTRNLDVTAGVRYRSERDRLDLRSDDRRDSQAVYVGTAFRF